MEALKSLYFIKDENNVEQEPHMLNDSDDEDGEPSHREDLQR